MEFKKTVEVAPGARVTFVLNAELQDPLKGNDVEFSSKVIFPLFGGKTHEKLQCAAQKIRVWWFSGCDTEYFEGEIPQHRPDSHTFAEMGLTPAGLTAPTLEEAVSEWRKILDGIVKNFRERIEKRETAEHLFAEQAKNFSEESFEVTA